MGTRRRRRPYGGSADGWAVRGGPAGGRAPSLASLASLASAARAGDDETVRGLLRAVQYTQDPEIGQEAAEYLGALALEQVLNPDPFAPPVPADEARGEIELGYVRNSGCPFGLWRTELGQHTLVLGRSGSGKTTAIKRILRELHALPGGDGPAPKTLVFDLKRDYDYMARVYPDVWLFALPGPGFRWNPLEPPIGDWRQWAGCFASTFANSCGFYGGASTENYLYRALLNVYTKYDPEKGIYPCLFDLLDALDAGRKSCRNSEEAAWLVRILNRLDSLCCVFGETMKCSRGYALDELLGHHVVFDISVLKADAQSFFTEMFLTQAVWRRMETGERGGRLRNLAVFDEAKRLIPRYREDAQQSISNMSTNIALGREFGVGFIVGECDPRLLGQSISSSCLTRICLNQSAGGDILDSARSLGLSAEQAEEIQKLETGEAIVRVAGRIKRPFVVKVVP